MWLVCGYCLCYCLCYCLWLLSVANVCGYCLWATVCGYCLFATVWYIQLFTMLGVSTIVPRCGTADSCDRHAHHALIRACTVKAYPMWSKSLCMHMISTMEIVDVFIYKYSIQYFLQYILYIFVFF